MSRNWFIIPFIFILSCAAFAQTHTFPATDTNNVFTGTNQFTVGTKHGPVTFANLPTESDGTWIYCTDCQPVAPCVGGGTGAFAQGLNGAWSCTSSANIPLTTKGDLLGFSGTNFVRVPVGSDGNCLVANSASSTGLSYGACGGGGGGGTPGGSAGQLQYNIANTTFGGIANGSTGYNLVSNPLGLASPPGFQQKVEYDIRDWGFNCTPGVYNTTPALTLIAAIGSQQASISSGPQANPCDLGDIIWPSNITLNFTKPWKIRTPTDTTTTPGNGQFDTTSGATGHCQSDNTTPNCNMSVTASANETYVIGCGRGFSGGALTFSSNVATDVVIPLATTSTAFSATTQAAIVPSIVAGAHTFTATSPGNLIGSCTAAPITGLGPTPFAIDTIAVCSNVSANSPYACSGTFTAGDFMIFVASQNNTPETCGAVGGGYTIIPGAAGCSTTTLSHMAMAYKNSSAGGTESPTIAFSPSPAGHNWAALTIGLRPASAINQILGPIVNPANNQIFVNALPGQGIIDFTGNTVGFDVWSEWWGALGNGSTNGTQELTNAGAINSAVIASFGNQNRINGSGLNIYNKRLRFCGTYNVNGQITFNHVNSFVIAGCGRLVTQLNEVANNTILWSGYQDAYGRFLDMFFNSSATQDANHPVMLLDYNPALGNDFRPQFIDFYSIGWGGSNTTAIGLLGAPSGGGAQFSNINCYDCNAIGFTQAAWQVGTPTGLAQNALQINWFGGDMQGNPQYGFANYGGGFIDFFGTSMENGFSAPTNGNQTGADFFCSAGQGPVVLYDVRSESRKLIWCDLAEVFDSRTIFQGAASVTGTSLPVNYIMSPGTSVTSDGSYYIVTVDGGPFGGAGTVSAPLTASSGTGTTITDTNQFITGSVTIGSVGVFNTELMTQATTGATGTRLNNPSSIAAIPGTLNSGAISFGDAMSQATTGVTCTAGANNSATNFNCSNFSGAADGTHLWTDTTSSATFTPSGVPVFPLSNPPMLVTATTGSPDSSHDWVGGSSGLHYTPTATPTNEANWSTNAFVGMNVGILTGTNQRCMGAITSNTSQTLTFSAGYTTQYPLTVCTSVDNTSHFTVDCPTGHSGTLTCGGMQYTELVEDTVRGGTTSTTPLQGRLQDSYFAGDTVRIANGNNGARTVMENVTVTRPDWNPINTYYAAGQGNEIDNYIDVRVFNLSGAAPMNWAMPHLVGAGTYTGGLHTDRGNNKWCWMSGTIGQTGPPSNISTGEVCIGDSNDPTASNDTFRNRVAIFSGTVSNGAAIGPMTPTGTNIAGHDLELDAGDSTGNANGGNISLRIAVAGSSGSNPNTGLTVWQVNGTTGNLLAFADNTYNIGAASANRPAKIFVGSDFVGPIGATTPNTGSFTTLQSSGVAILGSGVTKSIQTNTSSNSDLAGELAFSGATTSATYTFTGSYLSHPECAVTPQFSPGAGHVIWISTLSTTTLQFSSDTSQTGAVSYICVGRN